MSVKLYGEHELARPVMVCGWAGIGNVGLAAVGTLQRLLRAPAFGRIEPYGYFEPSRVVVRHGLICRMRFPATEFYTHPLAVKSRDWRSLLLLVGEQQPSDERKAYDMANEVLDIAEESGCRRIYTAAASITTIHHAAKPRVWAVPNTPDLLDEVRRYRNTVLMSDVDGTDGDGLISGLNGVLLGVAKSRGIEAVCLMGEVPYYLQAAPWPYPKASISVLEGIGEVFGLQLDLRELHEMAEKVEGNIERTLDALATAEELPEQVRMEMKRLKQGKHSDRGPITETEKREILEHIDELFRGESGNES
ncbi:MAG: PAC2 family protein [Sedimentisphaerales bacterium]|nr:PAC2 family protein [Sedimentisphaerales bacterium]